MDKHRVAIATVSLGWHDDHTLLEKANRASKNGFQGIELVFSDLAKAANSANKPLEEYAASFKRHCDELSLAIISLAPFENYEGSPLPLGQRISTACDWVRIARIVGASFIQVPASFDARSLVVSEDVIIDELRLLADCGLPRPDSNETTIEIAYEPMSWSVRSDTWQHALYTKRRVGRDNFKLCLDTYHILTKLWADCSAEDGRIPGGEESLKASLFETLRLMDPSDVGFVQLSDAERMQPPVSLAALREAGQHQAWYWSARGRIFPFEIEHGAYLPMVDICRTWLVDLGWSGWVSMEIFHSSMSEQDRDPQYWAKRGIESWRSVQEHIVVEQGGSRPKARL